MTTEELIRKLVNEEILKAHAAVLLVLSLSDTRGLSPTDIATKLGISKTRCTMVCRVLLNLGQVEQRFPIRDSRKINVYLTPVGLGRAGTIKLLFSELFESLRNDRDVVGSSGRGREVEPEVR